VRRALGESLSSIQKYDTPLEVATTPSLDALRAYTQGLVAFTANGDAAALVFQKRAIELDPNLALAHSALGSEYANLGQLGMARESFAKAYALRDRATERERYEIDGDYYTFATGETEKANVVYQQWRQAYPRDWFPLGKLVLNHLLSGQYELAA